MNVKMILLSIFIIFYCLPLVLNIIFFISNMDDDNKLSISDLLFTVFVPVVNCIVTFIAINCKIKNILVKNKMIKQQNKNEKITVKSFENNYIVKKFGIYFSIYNVENCIYINSEFIKTKKLIKKLIDYNGFTYTQNGNHIICFNTQAEALSFLEFLDSIFIIEKIEQNGE